MSELALTSTTVLSSMNPVTSNVDAAEAESKETIHFLPAGKDYTFEVCLLPIVVIGLVTKLQIS